MTSPRERLKAAREVLGKTPEELSETVGINTASYYDLEFIDEEVECAISLRTLQTLCRELGLQPSDLFMDAPIVPSERIPLSYLVTKIKDHLKIAKQTIFEFEDTVGFEIRRCLEDASAFLDWDIDCLRSVCLALGVDWRLALPWNGS
jgi:DNA-binding Xre family transcriptional regulator